MSQLSLTRLEIQRDLLTRASYARARGDHAAARMYAKQADEVETGTPRGPISLRLDNLTAPVLLALLRDDAAIERARAAADGSVPTSEDLQAAVAALASPVEPEPDLTPADMVDGPTPDEMTQARTSRDAERVQYARAGQPIRFGRDHCTAVEMRIATDLVRRRPGRTFDKALALLRQ